MAHKTLIGGTAYEITGGNTIVNGTAYSIKNGKTLVNGTAYEVEFVSIIEFKVGSSVYTANKGMTWTEYAVATNYADFRASDGSQVMTYSGFPVWYDSSKTTKVMGEDVITPNGEYYSGTPLPPTPGGLPSPF